MALFQMNKWQQLVDMPSHMSEHKSAVVTGRRFGREVMMTLGKTGGADNFKTRMFHIKKTIWRTGSDFPQEDDGGDKINLGNVSLEDTCFAIVMSGNRWRESHTNTKTYMN